MAFGFGQKNIGIDLGTANTSVFVEGQGVVISEPSYIAKNIKTGEIIAVGDQAKKYYGKTPPSIAAVRPLRNGVIDDLGMTIEMLRYFLTKAVNTTRSKPYVVVGVPLGVTPVERRAVIDAARSAGARDAVVMFEPFAAAVGEGLPVQSNSASMIVDIGGGTTDVATISYGGFLAKRSIRFAGDAMNEAIALKVRDIYSLAIDEATAENLKINSASASIEKAAGLPQTIVSGRDLSSGLPISKEVDPVEISRALQPTVNSIITAIRETLEETPPDSTADVISRGLQISGGGALLKDLTEVIETATHITVTVNPENAKQAVANGLGEAIRNFELFRDVKNAKN